MRRALRFLFFAALFTVTFEKVFWNVAGAVGLTDILAVCFLALYALDRIGRRDGRLPRTAGIVLVFTAVFLLVYLVGFFNLDTAQGTAQFGKGMFKFGVHFLFLLAGVSYLARRSERFYWQSVGVFCAGIVFNAAYGVVQLLAARSGFNLDHAVLSPLTGGASNINIYGAVEGASVYRPNALTSDPNHLGIMLAIPLLVLTPIYLRLERRHELCRTLGLTIAFLLVVEVATLSRSGILALLIGGLILLMPYRRFLAGRTLLAPLAGAAVVLAVVAASRWQI